jgi:SAM-dependent methyltransferase
MAALTPGADLTLACPQCGAATTAASGNLRCTRCGAEWLLSQGVACFGQADGYPLDCSSAQLAEALAIAERSGWQAALHDYLRPLDATAYRRAVDEYRAQWRCLLPLTPAARVLDLRCGWGPISIALAEECSLVVAADVRYEYARFTALRAEAHGLRHVRAVSLDPARRLPFPSGSLDGVVLHETLEWVNAGRLLAEVARVLAPHGWVFAGAANPLSPARLFFPRGAPASSSPPRAQTLGAYRRILARLGLGRQAAYAILPSVTEPFYLVPLENSAALRYLLDSLFDHAGLRLALARRNLLRPYQAAQTLWRASRWLPVAALARHFVPGFGLLARRISGTA